MNKKLIIIIFLLISNVLWSQKSEVTLLFLGDIMGHGPQIEAAFDAKTKTYNYENSFIFIKDILSKSDFCIGNLEVTLGTKPFSGYPLFSSPAELALAGKKAGIDLFATANNHACDRGKNGILKTISILDSLEISHFGTYINSVEKEKQGIMLLEKNGIKIGLLNYTYGTNGINIPAPTVVNLLDKEQILNDLEFIKKYKTDFIIAYVHWGSEYKDMPSAEQIQWFNFFVENGISVVIGSHPHVVEPMMWNKYNQTLVVYSLGNFISNQRFFPSDGGALFELTLTKNDENKVVISNAQYILTWVYKRILNGKTDFMVLPVNEFEYKKHFFTSETDFNQMIKFTRHVRKLLHENNINIAEKKIFTKDVNTFMREVFIYSPAKN